MFGELWQLAQEFDGFFSSSALLQTPAIKKRKVPKSQSRDKKRPAGENEDCDNNIYIYIYGMGDDKNLYKNQM